VLCRTRLEGKAERAFDAQHSENLHTIWRYYSAVTAPCLGRLTITRRSHGYTAERSMTITGILYVLTTRTVRTKSGRLPTVTSPSRRAHHPMVPAPRPGSFAFDSRHRRRRTDTSQRGHFAHHHNQAIRLPSLRIPCSTGPLE
jgi:hypothetical protein